MRKNIAAGNWKMNCTFEEACLLAEEVANGSRNSNALTILGVPFLYLNKIKSILAEHKNIEVAAQDCHTMSSGAYTGEISAAMLASCQVKYVILGHSERREYFYEDSSVLNKKVDQALSNGLIPIFCCGESLDVRKSGQHLSFVITQLKETIFNLSEADFSNIIIAYEPIWAIGTGETATSEQAQEMHAAIRAAIADVLGNDIAQGTSILYGGSVKSDNAVELFGMSDVDGGLVGGASLKSGEFLKIINSFS